MIQKFLTILILFIMILHPQVIHADNQEYIEIFDPQQNKVVEKVPLSEEINNMVADWINNIDEIYTTVNPIRDDGYAIRFPLDPAIEMKNKWINTTAEEIYLIVPQKDPSFLIVFETENKPVFFLFPGEIDKLSDVLDFQLK